MLRLIAPTAVGVEIPIAPFSAIFDALAAGDVDAALLIHEGRLLYPQRGLQLVVDLGAWWQAETALPLPLGVNVVRRALGAPLVARVSAVVRSGIDWGLAHRDEIIAAIAAEDRGDQGLADRKLIDHYLTLYANRDTAELPATRAARSRCCSRGHTPPGCCRNDARGLGAVDRITRRTGRSRSGSATLPTACRRRPWAPDACDHRAALCWRIRREARGRGAPVAANPR